MATPTFDEANIHDSEPINWRLIVYPILAVVVLAIGGLSFYLYHQSQQEIREADACKALNTAKTPEGLIKVADDFAGTFAAQRALLSAAALSFGKQDYDGAAKDYQRLIGGPDADALLSESARLGLASAYEAANKTDDALTAYLAEARLGKKSPYAPFAYLAAARIYEAKEDKDNEKKILLEASSLNPGSAFVQEAQAKLKELDAAAAPAPAPATTVGGTPAPATKP